MSDEPGQTNGTDALNWPTLVLNRSWIPVNVTTVRRAVILLVRGCANVVDPGTYETFDFSSWVRQDSPPEPAIIGVRISIPVPEVVVLSRYDRIARRHLPFTRRNLYRRDKMRCQYCGRRPGMKSLTIDHVVPRAHGGATSWTNCVLACADCNGRKGGRTPEQVGMRLLSPPRRPQWASALGPAVPSLQAFLRPRDRPGARAS